MSALFSYTGTRYGGWDPVQNIDNDFAAVYIKHSRNKRSAGNGIKARDASISEMVSAEWHSVDVANAKKNTISHVTGTGEFKVRIGKCDSGTLKISFVYADVFGSPYGGREGQAGGHIACVELQYTVDEKGKLKMKFVEASNEESTGYSWTGYEIGRKAQQRGIPLPTPIYNDKYNSEYE